jgi:hypothetical protein
MQIFPDVPDASKEHDAVTDAVSQHSLGQKRQKPDLSSVVPDPFNFRRIPSLLLKPFPGTAVKRSSSTK